MPTDQDEAPAGEWRAIETAPKDESVILWCGDAVAFIWDTIWRASGGFATEGYYEAESDCWRPVATYGVRRVDLVPTHWMQLAPPKAQPIAPNPGEGQPR